MKKLNFFSKPSMLYVLLFIALLLFLIIGGITIENISKKEVIKSHRSTGTILKKIYSVIPTNITDIITIINILYNLLKLFLYIK